LLQRIGYTKYKTFGFLTPTATTFSLRNDADLGPFSAAIYKKITADAKQQSFQGFRPGTIPPHLEPTYRAFAMNECARETVLEAMQQNDIRPFTEAREALVIEDVSIPPPQKKAKKKKGGRKNKAAAEAAAQSEEPPAVEEVPKWLTFESMKGAIDAGWKVRCAIDTANPSECAGLILLKHEWRLTSLCFVNIHSLAKVSVS
jgi:hypothetical protein